MIDLPDVAVHMIHPALGDLPAWPLPASYNVRAYRAGDIDTWVKCWRCGASPRIIPAPCWAPACSRRCITR